jgi:hypothetical protein
VEKERSPIPHHPADRTLAVPGGAPSLQPLSQTLERRISATSFKALTAEMARDFFLAQCTSIPLTAKFYLLPSHRQMAVRNSKFKYLKWFD